MSTCFEASSTGNFTSCSVFLLPGTTSVYIAFVKGEGHGIFHVPAARQSSSASFTLATAIIFVREVSVASSDLTKNGAVTILKDLIGTLWSPTQRRPDFCNIWQF